VIITCYRGCQWRENREISIFDMYNIIWDTTQQLEVDLYHGIKFPVAGGGSIRSWQGREGWKGGGLAGEEVPAAGGGPVLILHDTIGLRRLRRRWLSWWRSPSSWRWTCVNPPCYCRAEKAEEEVAELVKKSQQLEVDLF
jgi:hypothetical protein